MFTEPREVVFDRIRTMRQRAIDAGHSAVIAWVEAAPNVRSTMPDPAEDPAMLTAQQQVAADETSLRIQDARELAQQHFN